jgi:rhamnosyltransferase
MLLRRIYILLATYEGDAFLPELLKSIKDQSHGDWTLLVRDDGSRDTTPQILREASRIDPRVVIAKDDGRQLGAVGNFAWLLQQAYDNLADYVLTADQDDVWQTDKVARQVHALQTAEARVGREVPQLVYCDATVVDAGRRPLHASFLRQNRLPHGSGRPLKTLLGRSFVLGCACAVNRSLLELALPMPEVVPSHDWWLALCAAAAGRITCLDDVLLEYRRHAANASKAAFWNLLRKRDLGWTRRWEIGWKTFLRSLEQAKALRDRLHERKVAASEEREVLETYCRIVEEPNRFQRLWEMHRLGVPAIDWPRRVLFDCCMLWV